MAKKSKMYEFDYLNISPRLLRGDGFRWYWIVAFILAGALVGFMLSIFLKPIYEATATVVTNMDISRESNVTDVMVGSQMGHISKLIYDPAILDDVVTSERKLGNTVRLDVLMEISTVEPKLMDMLIKVRHADPVIAARIANTWAEATFQRLTWAYPHAVRVSDAQLQLTMLENCVSNEAAMKMPFCQELDLATADQIRAKANDVLVKEYNLSLGLTRHLSVNKVLEAHVPSTPLSYKQSDMILAGALIGFVLAVTFVEIRKGKA